MRARHDVIDVKHLRKEYARLPDFGSSPSTWCWPWPAILIIVLGSLGFSGKLPGNAAGFVLAVVLAIAALFAIGTWLAAVARTAKAAAAIAMALYFPLLFFAGLRLPRQEMPTVLLDRSGSEPRGRNPCDLLHGDSVPSGGL